MAKDIYVHRQIEPSLKAIAKQFPAIGITGPRQSGKSTLLKKLFARTHHFISLDDPLTRQKAVLDPRLFLDNIREPVVFDEIQYVPEILSYLKIAIDRNRNKRGRFILTGSQQFNLIKNLGDTLAGRIALLTLLPFSKEEKGHMPAQREKISSPQQFFTDACLRGSFPEISVRPKIDFETWYGSYLETYLERDVRSTYMIGSLREFHKFLQLLATRCSQVLNLNSLATELGVSINTIKKWISVLEASHLIYLLNPYYRNLGKRITKAPKVYFLDSGIVCYLTGIRDSRHLLNGPMAGALFENYIIQETIKCFFNQGRRPNIFYLRTHNDVEVDLIIEKNMQLFPLEIKMSKSPNTNMAKPIERFKKIFSKLAVKPGKIICLSDEDGLLTKDASVCSLDTYLKWIKEL
ncbi:MAG: ATP-binding protein [Candidatus Omnitrophica bacterium]|nr:ATP-binding protein [Candidatus Omnitrophota bacterium]MDD5353370.1 ATP-binding protein [Candidatus Omnitrophota bacterium]MDD5592070.1 ATP-binding protein [Candidatus Omnitrophota bacterium]